MLGNRARKYKVVFNIIIIWKKCSLTVFGVCFFCFFFTDDSPKIVILIKVQYFCCTNSQSYLVSIPRYMVENVTIVDFVAQP